MGHALSVHHGRAMEDYRKDSGRADRNGEHRASRESMIHYRALFEDLTGLREGPSVAARDRAADTRRRP